MSYSTSRPSGRITSTLPAPTLRSRLRPSRFSGSATWVRSRTSSPAPMLVAVLDLGGGERCAHRAVLPAAGGRGAGHAERGDEADEDQAAGAAEEGADQQHHAADRDDQGRVGRVGDAGARRVGHAQDPDGQGREREGEPEQDRTALARARRARGACWIGWVTYCWACHSGCTQPCWVCGVVGCPRTRWAGARAWWCGGPAARSASGACRGRRSTRPGARPRRRSPAATGSRSHPWCRRPVTGRR